MGKIFLTGDMHIPIDIKKLNTRNFPIQNELTRDDYVIVLGDFGLLWHENDTYRHWKEWLEKRNFTLLWLDGNHENHDWINSLPVSEWNGGKVHRIADNIIHLMRGQVFTIEGKTFFTMGGGTSVDKAYRTEGISWWAGENISYRDIAEGLTNLEKYNNKVDYVLTHSMFTEAVDLCMGLRTHYSEGPAEKALHKLSGLIKYSKWFYGHFHENMQYGNKFYCLYNNIVRLDDNSVTPVLESRAVR